MKKLIIYTDGGSRGNPGEAAIGVVIKSESGKNIAFLSRRIGKATNNIAEYQAVIEALAWVKKNLSSVGTNIQLIEFFLDSNLVVNQLNGIFKIKDSDLRDLLLKIRILEQEIGRTITYKSIPRERNFEADRLVNRALDFII